MKKTLSPAVWERREGCATRQPSSLTAAIWCAVVEVTIRTSTQECGSATANFIGAATLNATHAVKEQKYIPVSEYVAGQAGMSLAMNTFAHALNVPTQDCRKDLLSQKKCWWMEPSLFFSCFIAYVDTHFRLLWKSAKKQKQTNPTPSHLTHKTEKKIISVNLHL